MRSRDSKRIIKNVDEINGKWRIIVSNDLIELHSVLIKFFEIAGKSEQVPNEALCNYRIAHNFPFASTESEINAAPQCRGFMHSAIIRLSMTWGKCFINYLHNFFSPLFSSPIQILHCV